MGSESGREDPRLEDGTDSGAPRVEEDSSEEAAFADAQPMDFSTRYAVTPYLKERLEKEACTFEFFQAVRLLERLLPDRAPIGRYAQPRNEVVRFKTHTGLEFPASDIQGIEFPENGIPRVVVNFMGLTGPAGILPLYYTELVRERLRSAVL